MKKTISIFAVVGLMLAIMPITALAHGHGGSSLTTVKYSLCSVENCNTAGTHAHNGTYYYGHYVGDGHDYHQICSVKGCTETINHQHDGVTCFPHANGDGHSYHSSQHSGGYHH